MAQITNQEILDKLNVIEQLIKESKQQLPPAPVGGFLAAQAELKVVNN